MRSIRLATFAAALFCAVSLSAAVIGVVADQSGKPLAGATIRVFAQETRAALIARLDAGTLQREPLASTTAAANGTFSINVPSRSVGELVVSAADHAYLSFDVAATDDVGTLLLPVAKPISGTVTAAGRPLAGAIAVTADGAFSVRSGDDGTWSLPRNAGSPSIAILHRDFAPLERVADAKPFDASLDRGVEIRGRVLAPNGRADTSGATIIAGRWTIARSDAEGAFVIAHAPSKWQALRVASAAGGAIVANANAKSYDVHLRKPGSVAGVVRDSKTGEPVSGFRIRLSLLTALAIEETQITNAKGEYAFRGMAPGRYDIDSSHPLYILQADDMMENLGVGEDDVIDFAANALAIVRGRVIDETKTPLAGVAIASGSSPAPPRMTAADGSFMLRVAAAPALELIASRSGYVTEVTPIAAVAGEPKSVVITLRRGIALAVHIVDDEAKPVADAMLSLVDPAAGMRSNEGVRACGLKPCVSGSDGIVNARVLAGTYDVDVHGQAIATKRLGAVAIDERSSPMTITVTRGLEVSGRALFADGQPAPNAMILVKSGGTAMFVAAQDDGTFAIHNAAPQPLRLHAELPQVRIPGEEKDVTPPATGIELVVRRGGRVSGHVIDAASHEPVTDFNIYVMRGHMPSRQAIPFQAEDGSFMIDNLPPGVIELQVAALGHARASANGIEIEEAKTASGIEVKMERAARLKGRITTADGQGVSGATAYVKEPAESASSIVDRVMSDANGAYEIGSVPPGTHTIIFTKQGFIRQEKSVDAAGGKELHLDVQLERGRAVTGRVVTERGEPIAAADIFTEPGARTPQRTRSDADGAFRLEGLGDGTIRIRAQKDGFAASRLEIDPSSTAPVTITLRRGATISGRVSGLAPEQLGAVHLYATASDFMQPVMGLVSANGAFTLTGIPDGMVAIHASIDGRSVEKNVEVANGAAPPIELAFVEGFNVHGRVTVNGRALPGAFVHFSPDIQGASPATTQTSGDGTYQVAGIAAGDYIIDVSANYQGSIATERRTISGPTTHDFEVKASTIRGRVVDARTQQPLPDARLLLNSSAEMAWMYNTITSDSDGRFTFEFVKPATYTINAQRDSYASARKTVNVSDGNAEVELQLEPGTATTIRFVDAVTGAPLAGRFTLSSGGAPAFSGETTSEDGRGRAFVPAGKYSAKAFAPGYAPADTTLDVPGPEVRIALARGGRIVVTMARPVPRVRITGPVDYLTGGTFENLPAGDYVVSPIGEDKPIASKKVTVRAGETTNVTFD